MVSVSAGSEAAQPTGAVPAVEHGPAEPAADRRLVFAVVASALFMNSVDQTIVATALPEITGSLHTRLGWTAWTITIYALGQVLAKPLAGALNDRFGARFMFLGSVLVFTLASLVCGLAADIYMLVGIRFVQALGGGTLVPTGSALLADRFGRDRDRALGLFASVVPVGALVGPVLGGLLVESGSWRLIFLVNVPIGVVVLLVGIARVPPVPVVGRTGAPDVRGALLLTATIVAAMVAITELGDVRSKALQAIVVPCGAAAAICLSVVLIRHLSRVSNPIIPLYLLRSGSFGTMNLINFLYGCSALGLAALVPLYAERRFAIPPVEAGTLLTARAVGNIAVTGLATFALRRTGYRLPMVVGTVTIACGLTLMAWSPVRPATLWLALTATLAGVGMGIMAPASNNASIYLAPGQLAAIVGLRGTFRQLGSITAVSVGTAFVEGSANGGLALAYVFLAFAVLIALTVPLVLSLPDHRGSW